MMAAFAAFTSAGLSGPASLSAAARPSQRDGVVLGGGRVWPLTGGGTVANSHRAPQFTVCRINYGAG